MIDGDSRVQFSSQHKERELREGDNHPNFVDAFIAYSPPGDVEGQLFYVNYARIEDFQVNTHRDNEKVMRPHRILKYYSSVDDH